MSDMAKPGHLIVCLFNGACLFSDARVRGNRDLHRTGVLNRGATVLVVAVDDAEDVFYVVGTHGPGWTHRSWFDTDVQYVNLPGSVRRSE